MAHSTPARNELTEASSEETTSTKGQVRIRSNVCTDPKAWHLVPGYVVQRYGLQYGINNEQREEMMYYEPCCLCHRLIYEINRDGCDHPICRQLTKYR